MKIEGAIFDVDGTLLDSMKIWRNVGEDYLRNRGIVPIESINERFQSMSMQQVAKYYQEKYNLGDSEEKISRDINSMVEDFYLHSAMPKSGVKDFLELLKKKRVHMCIATATDRYLIESALKRLGLRRYFEEIFTCSEVGSGKDTPLIYEAALSFLGTEKSRTVIFEDALYAVKTAKLANFPVVAVKDESMKEKAGEIRALSDFYINGFEELYEEIK